MKITPAPLRAAALLLAAAAFPIAPLLAQVAPAADPPAEEAQPEPVTIQNAPPAPERPAAQIPNDAEEETRVPEAAPAPARTTRTTRTTTTSTRSAPAAAPVTVVVPSAPVATAPASTLPPADFSAVPPTAAPLPADALPAPEVLPDTGGGTDIANVTTTQEEGGTSPLVWLLGGLLVAAALAALLLLGRRRRRGADVYHEQVREAPAPRPVMRDPVIEEPAPVRPPETAAPAIAAATPLHRSPVEPVARHEPEVRARPATAAAPADSGMVISSLGLAGAGLGAAGVAAAQRTETREEQTVAPVAAAAAPAAAADTGRPWLDLFLRPVRAGVSGADAIVEFELAVTNQGSAAARHVRVSTWMLAAGPGQDSEMERMLIERDGNESASDLPEVTIDAGAAQKIETSVALRTAGLSGEAVLPVVVAEARYRLPDGSEGRTSASFAVGVPDGEELAHFSIANASGLHEGVEARALGEPERR